MKTTEENNKPQVPENLKEYYVFFAKSFKKIKAANDEAAVEASRKETNPVKVVAAKQSRVVWEK